MESNGLLLGLLASMSQLNVFDSQAILHTAKIRVSIEPCRLMPATTNASSYIQFSQKTNQKI